MKSKFGMVAKITLALLSVLVAVYGWYWTSISTLDPRPDPRVVAMHEIGRAALKQSKVANAELRSHYSFLPESGKGCNFFTFEHARVYCITSAVFVPRDQISQYSPQLLAEAAEIVGRALVRPCDHLNLVSEAKRTAMMKDLGCSQIKLSYRLRIQVREAWREQFPNGSTGKSRLIHEVRFDNGEI